MSHSVIAEPGPVGTARLSVSTAPPPPRTLVDIFAQTVVHHPGAPALDDGVTRLTYRALTDWVERGARKLRAHGIGPGDRVGIAMPSGRADLYVAILAVLASGAAYVPADFDEPGGRAELGSRAG